MEEIKINESYMTEYSKLNANKSIKEFFRRCENNSPMNSQTNINKEYLWKKEKDYIQTSSNDDNSVLIEIDIIYQEGDACDSVSKTNLRHLDIEEQKKPTENKENKEISFLLDLYKQSARIYLPNEKVIGTFVEEELKKGENNESSLNNRKNYMKIELKARKNKIMLESIIDCFEYLMDKNFEFHFNKENLISYFYAFSLCKLADKRREVLERLLLDLSDDNIIYFLKVVANLDDNFLSSYSFWLLRYIINKNEKGDKINFNGYDFETIVKLSPGMYCTFESNRVLIKSYKNSIKSLSANLNFLKNYYESFKKEIDVFYKTNNHFNMGRVLRRKSNDNFGLDDYPHYFQLLLENDPNIVLFAIRQSENSNFIISRSYDDFSKYGINFVAEIVPNFWGTFFDVYDFGFEKGLYDSTPKVLSKPRESIVRIFLF
jgi:hypothetical protein